MRTRRELGLASLALIGATSCGQSPPAACAYASDLDADQCAALAAMRLPTALPASRGNAHADDPAAANFGFQLFFDARLSENENVRCASCHAPETTFQDGLPTAIGLGPMNRNTPTMFNAARVGWVDWDGRADSIWSQAIAPLETSTEMGLTPLEVAHKVAQYFAAQYTPIFGPLPPLDDSARFPAVGGPGDATYDEMTTDDQHAVDLVAANLGKAFEAYARQLPSGPSPFDRYLDGDASALTAQQQRGMVVFAQAGCPSCHGGPYLSDDAFHNLGMSSGANADRGRTDGLALLAASRFNAQGAFYDGDPAAPPPAATDADLAAFRTPSLRNVASTAPYGHDGRFAKLEDVVVYISSGAAAADPAHLGTIDPLLVPHSLSQADVDALVAFLVALTGTSPPPPWNDWPQH